MSLVLGVRKKAMPRDGTKHHASIMPPWVIHWMGVQHSHFWEDGKVVKVEDGDMAKSCRMNTNESTCGNVSTGCAWKKAVSLCVSKDISEVSWTSGDDCSDITMNNLVTGEMVKRFTCYRHRAFHVLGFEYKDANVAAFLFPSHSMDDVGGQSNREFTDDFATSFIDEYLRQYIGMHKDRQIIVCGHSMGCVIAQKVFLGAYDIHNMLYACGSAPYAHMDTQMAGVMDNLYKRCYFVVNIDNISEEDKRDDHCFCLGTGHDPSNIAIPNRCYHTISRVSRIHPFTALERDTWKKHFKPETYSSDNDDDDEDMDEENVYDYDYHDWSSYYNIMISRGSAIGAPHRGSAPITP